MGGELREVERGLGGWRRKGRCLRMRVGYTRGSVEREIPVGWNSCNGGCTASSRESDLERATPPQHIHFVFNPVMRAAQNLLFPLSCFGSLSSPLLLSPPRSSFSSRRPSSAGDDSPSLFACEDTSRQRGFRLPSVAKVGKRGPLPRECFDAQRDRSYVGVRRALGGRLQ